MSLYELKSVVQAYGAGPGRGPGIEALRVHELAVDPGEVLGVVGPNGSGKTTLLETLAFLLRPSQGVVCLGGDDIWASGQDLAARRRAPMLLQRTVLFAGSALANVCYGLQVRGGARRAAIQRGMRALEEVGLAHLAQRRHDQLSGGEKRRVALARVLALESRILILDEPTAGLDQESEGLIENIVKRMNRENGTTVILASHNMRQAVALSSRLVTLLSGKLVAAHLDNVLSGSMAQDGDSWVFRDRSGWLARLEPSCLASDSWEGIGPVSGRVKLAVPSAGIEILSPGSAPRLGGQIDSVRQEGDVVRLRVCLREGPRLHACMALAAYRNGGFNVGAKVGFRFCPQAVRVFSETLLTPRQPAITTLA